MSEITEMKGITTPERDIVKVRPISVHEIHVTVSFRIEFCLPQFCKAVWVFGSCGLRNFVGYTFRFSVLTKVCKDLTLANISNVILFDKNIINVECERLKAP